MSDPGTRLLVVGYGNPGRGDDGLGPAFAEAVEKLDLPGVTVDVNYQLTVEITDAVARHPVVVFADAELRGPEPFWFRPVKPRVTPGWSFTSHHLDPTAVLALAEEIFGARPVGYLLGIRGYAFEELKEALTANAAANLAAAVQFFQAAWQEGSLQPSAAGAAPLAAEVWLRRNHERIQDCNPVRG